MRPEKPNSPGWRLLAIFILYVLGIMVSPAAVHGADSTHVLVLNSYHRGFAWTDRQTDAVAEILSPEIDNLKLHVEYMDTKRISDGHYLQVLRNFLAVKYESLQLDAIVATDDNALAFLAECRDELFGPCPVVFTGINDSSVADRTRLTNSTGLLEALDLKPTLDLILQLHPQARRIAVIVDNTPTGRGMVELIEQDARDYPEMDFVYLSGENLTTSMLMEKVGQLSDDTVALNAAWARGAEGVYLSLEERCRLISKASPVPLYGLHCDYLGNGIVGGKLLDSRSHGLEAGRRVLRILRGERAETIPISREGFNEFMFDNAQLQRWGIDPRALPSGSVVINKPATLYSRYRGWILGIGSVFAALVALVAGLAGSIVLRRRSEKSLRQSEERFRQLAELLPEVVFEMNTEGIMTFVNKAAFDISGYSPQDIERGFNCIDFFVPEDRQFAFENVKRVLGGGVVPGQEYTALRKDGSTFPVIVRSARILRDGQPVGIRGILLDVTEQKQVEERLRRTTNMLNSILTSVTAYGIVALGPDLRITHVNPGAEEIWGCSRDKALGKKVYEIAGVKGVVPERFCRAVERANREGKSEYDVQIERQKGQTRFIHCTVNPMVDETGRRVGYVHISADMTEAKLAEEKLLQHAALLKSKNFELEVHWEQLKAQQQELAAINMDLERTKRAADAANKAKSEFVANMSHEIRTPMTAILGFAENLRDQDLAESERMEAVNAVWRNGHHLLEIINDILDLSKIEAGRMEVERLRCSLFELVDNVASTMASRAAEKGLSFSVEYAERMPETIQTDPTRLRQILINLLGNAVKFTEAGEVRLVIHLTDQVSNCGHLHFDVIDTGIGMTDEQAGRAFHAFSQADASTSRRFGGTGLGLSISKRLAKLLGGDVSLIESAPGQGSCFRVTIETGSLAGVRMVRSCDIRGESQARAETPAGLDETAPLKGCRILLAEDGPDNQRLIRFVLQKAGAEVSLADNGQMAVEFATAALDNHQPFDVILMDMQMPVMDGYEATRWLREHGYDRPVIALTAHAMEGDRLKCLEAGCDDYATKPINREGLIGMLRRYARQSEAVGAG